MAYFEWGYPIDRIATRRQINQYIIDTLCKGIRSNLCFCYGIYCWNSIGTEQKHTKFMCDKCLHLYDMTNNIDRAFIGFTPMIDFK